MTVLVITEPCDVTADLVIGELNQRGVRVHRIDTAAFPQPGLDSLERRWADSEARMGFGGVLTALPAHRWMNHPHAEAAASYKPRQLTVAAAHGLAVPPTIITNNPDRARRFVTDAPDGAIYKPLHARPYIDSDSGQTMALPTTPVTADQITDAVSGTAHLFQHQISKAYELRITIVAGRVFAARIDAHSDAARIDWRTDYGSLAYTAVELPDRSVWCSPRLTSSSLPPASTCSWK